MKIENESKKNIENDESTVINNTVKNMNVKVDGKALFILAQIILVVLKLAGVLNVSWWIVLLPILVPTAFLVLLVAVMFIAGIISPSFREKIIKASDDNEEND